MDLLLLTFIGGFVVATLIFWPLLRRSNRQSSRTDNSAGSRSAHQRELASRNSATPHGRHAAIAGSQSRASAPTTQHGDGNEPETPETGNQLVERIKIEGIDSANSSKAPGRAEFVDAIRIDGELAPTPPRQRTSEPAAVPVPTNLYERHFEARFNRCRKRVQRLRDELAEWEKHS